MGRRLSNRKPTLTRRKLENLARESIHNARNWSKADVSVAEWPKGSGQRVVIKDMRRRPLWLRVLAGRYMLWREWHALRALRGIPGIPKAIARPDADCLVMQHMPGKPIETRELWKVPEDAVEKIACIVQEIHARGVTHGDLHGYNILISREGEIALIDWATACVFGPKPTGPKLVAFNEWRALDERSVAKVILKFSPYGISERERELLIRGSSSVYRIIKNLRNWRLKAEDVDEKTAQRRERRQQKFEQRLHQATSSRSEQERLRLREEIIRQRQQQKEEALALKKARRAARQAAGSRPENS